MSAKQEKWHFLYVLKRLVLNNNDMNFISFNDLEIYFKRSLYQFVLWFLLFSPNILENTVALFVPNISTHKIRG
jgi:hypothetical protein